MKRTLSSLFVLAGLGNVLGILLISAGFTNKHFHREYKELFAREGCVGIILWGLAYIAASQNFERVPYVALVFALEKLFYACTWMLYMQDHYTEMGLVLHRDATTGLFFYFYGLFDLFFAVVFFVAYVYARSLSSNSATGKEKAGKSS